ncbi:hypothetical protein PMAL9190_00407 [Photobacterium malacitanum]|uniref:Uncharacterized protein n=1 Tax=Photobacterium malacitanum TaxID=2204294 RepID=A0A1Y6M6L8_9GAMM|nr:hypothetical protein [Photobacterium malacitanum]SMY32202.1 hypothetical protein PMAL9190_00407 [Photobacterium malacitanum]
MMTPLAISNYLGLFLLLVLVYPFAMLAINFVIYEQSRRNKIAIWFSVICVLVAILLLVLHMNIEIIYGKELLDAWRLQNPQLK